MRLFEVGQEVLFYRGKARVYATVTEYIDDDTLVVEVPEEDGDPQREVILEMYVRDADDPDDPEDDW